MVGMDIPDEAVEAADKVFNDLFEIGQAFGPSYVREMLEAAAPHMLAGALLGHISRGRMEGFVGDRCDCGRWFDSDAEYIAHVTNPYRNQP